jgi:hypothetical protein
LRELRRAAEWSRLLVFAQVADVIELLGLHVRARRVDLRQGRFAQNLGGDVLDRAICASWMKLMFRYSPDATREMTSRLVTSGSTMASRPRRPSSIITTSYRILVT